MGALLQRFFQRYEEVIDWVFMKNAESGRSRGAGFVTFADLQNVEVVSQSGPHTLEGERLIAKPCNPGTLQKPKKDGGYSRVYLGGLPSNITETDLRAFFTRFGKVKKVVIKYDHDKIKKVKKSRGFGFISFEDDDSVDRCVSKQFVKLNGKQVEIKNAYARVGLQAPIGVKKGPNGHMKHRLLRR